MRVPVADTGRHRERVPMPSQNLGFQAGFWSYRYWGLGEPGT
ncbi:hypothetical protein F0726_02998 [Acidithiobacillus caldus]|nr:hypothetical protein F0726_02998 [Acidithiobacillus caldus]